MGQLGIDPRLLLSQAINFALMAFILYRLLHKPLLAALDARAKRVQESMAKAKEADLLLQQMQERYASEIERAHQEAHEIVEQGSRSAEQQRQEILAAARDEAQQIIARAQAQAQRELELGEVALRQEIVDLSIAAASRVIGQELDESKHHRLIQDFLEQVKTA
ncbi:MAG: F0F1 ATP synthase subunit B [Chloroflexi bacterium]|nr:F0F1 ATP synthase subunit B [Chloroflexota bacterium]